MNRIMIAGTHSGCGKTTITCGILQAFVNRKLKVASFKCGPDYIDPMFHSRILGTHSRNLDPFFCDQTALRQILSKNGAGCDISVIEGVMGYYDGVGETASSYQVAMDTGTPTILVIDCRGMSRSIEAVLKGFLTLYKQTGIQGVIFNRLPASLAGWAEELCHMYQISFLGGFPASPDCRIASRHLGLVTAQEICNLKETLQRLAALSEEYLKLDELISIAGRAKPFTEKPKPVVHTGTKIPIAVARDPAFCFYYEDNLDWLRELGAELVEFSPLEDKQLPEKALGLILGGGYPELYLEKLSRNDSMREDIRQKLNNGMPVIAECGGFMYLHESICDGEPGASRAYPMAGVIAGTAYPTKRLQRFGYVELTAREDYLLGSRGHTIRAHEFHYWDSTSCGEAYTAKKASRPVEYVCAHGTKRMYAGFPHLYFNRNREPAENFLNACRDYQKECDKG